MVLSPVFLPVSTKTAAGGDWPHAGARFLDDPKKIPPGPAGMQIQSE